MPVRIVSFDTFDALLAALRQLPTVRLVKLADYGFVAPARGAGGVGIVMLPQVKIVATAYDRTANELLRWEEVAPANQTVTIHVGAHRGRHGDSRVRARTALLRQRLELEGFAVSVGEWTAEEIDQALAAG